MSIATGLNGWGGGLDLCRLWAGDHLYAQFSADEERDQLVMAFVRDAIDEGQKIIPGLAPQTIELLSEMMAAPGGNSLPSDTFTSAVIYSDNGGALELNVELLLAMLEEELRAAATPPAGARIVLDLTPFGTEPGNERRLLAFKRGFDSLLQDYLATAIWLFDQRCCAPNILLALRDLHQFQYSNGQFLRRCGLAGADQDDGEIELVPTPPFSARLLEEDRPGVCSPGQGAGWSTAGFPPSLTVEGASFKLLMANILDIITILDPQGRVVYQSPSIERSLGWTASEFRGKNVFELIHLEDLPWVMEKFSRGIEVPGAEESVIFRIQHKDGSWRMLSAVAKNALAEPGVQGIVVSSRDITDEQKKNHAVREFNKTKAFTKLAGTMAADFDAVFESVGKDAEYAIAKAGATEARPYLEHLKVGTERGRELVRQLQTFSSHSTE
jgi:PAS domain S-box-containing protein